MSLSGKHAALLNMYMYVYVDHNATAKARARQGSVTQKAKHRRCNDGYSAPLHFLQPVRRNYNNGGTSVGLGLRETSSHTYWEIEESLDEVNGSSVVFMVE